MRLSLLVLILVAVPISINSQQVGTETANVNLDLQLEECTGKENCTPVRTKITLDANWRWLHEAGGYQNCYSGNIWDDTLCPNVDTCGQNCCIDGVGSTDWTSTYGVKSDGHQLSLQFITQGAYSTNVGSRVFLLDESGEKYKIFKLKNREFTLDVDMSDLPCGLNGAVYLVEMDPDGGLSKYPGNKAGAAYGTGYCDAQCPHDLKYINGEPNVKDWDPSDVDPNSGFGHYGSCCAELDIWEANSEATAFTLHPCDKEGAYRCEGIECGDNKSDNRYDGVCDKDGCDFHHWRLGDRQYFGPGPQFKVDTTKPITVVTQFLTDDGTDSGELVEMRRIYLQDGVIIDNSFSNIQGIDQTDSINANMCDQMKTVFGDPLDFQKKGGLSNFGKAMERGMVLVLSLWDDFESHMLWLDSDFPLDRDPSEPGVSRGPCSRDSGDPNELANNSPSATARFSKLRVGALGSTYPGGGPVTTSRPHTTTMQPVTTDGPHTTADTDCPGGDLDHCVALCPDSPQPIHDGCVDECKNQCEDTDCPGGDLDHCLALCPDSPQPIHDGCVQECNDFCRSMNI